MSLFSFMICTNSGAEATVHKTINVLLHTVLTFINKILHVLGYMSNYANYFTHFWASTIFTQFPYIKVQDDVIQCSEYQNNF